MPKGVYKRKRKAPARRPHHKNGPLALVERAILRAYTAGADATDIEKAHTEARIAYARERMGLKIPRRVLG